jgi:uncharacterized membrane protein
LNFFKTGIVGFVSLLTATCFFEKIVTLVRVWKRVIFMATVSSTGLPKNTAGALSYVLGPVTGIVFLVLEKDSFVRFHAMQSIVVFVSLFVLQVLLGLTVILAVVVPLVSILSFVLWLLLIYKAWQGEEWEVPMLGVYARRFVKKV